VRLVRPGGAVIGELESRIKADIRLRLSRKNCPDLVLWSNVKAATAHGIQGGLGPDGSSDLIGVLACSVVYLGRSMLFGRLFCLEVKRPGAGTARKRREDQDSFLALVRDMGGFGAYVRSADESYAALERARKGEDR
jgi:hypothetical protein